MKVSPSLFCFERPSAAKGPVGGRQAVSVRLCCWSTYAAIAEDAVAVTLTIARKACTITEGYYMEW
jgi:hypothetical protein